MKYKNIKGLTLVEILVSVVITILVMVYGLNLFIASWKLSVESAEYNFVLQYLSNQIENLKTCYSFEDLSFGSISNKDIVLPSGKTANIKIRIYDVYRDNVIKDAAGNYVVTGAVPVSVSAWWPAKADPSNPENYIVLAESNEHLETISINTYIGSNKTL